MAIVRDGLSVTQCRVWTAVACLLTVHLAGCGGSNSSASNSSVPVSPPTGSILQPTTIDLYPVTSAADGNRLFVMVTAVGSKPVNMPLAFDTGSSGITLYAPDIFPSSMVTSKGFVFAPGQTSLTYDGITVTNQAATRKYGSPTTGRSQTGNIGFAQVTFGDAAGQLVTDVMPVFLYYLITDNLTGQPQPPPNQRGWFGVDAAPGLVAAAGSTEPATGYPACALGTLGGCYVVSVLKYLHYASGLDGGFILKPATLQSCDITLAGSCAPGRVLTVGLDNSVETGFSMVNLNCPPTGYSGPGSINGYTVCQAGIPDTTVTVSGSANGVLAGTVLFDSGTPSVVLNAPTGAVFPTNVLAGASVMVVTPSGFTYDYTAGAGSDVTDTQVQSGSNVQSIVGIGYFTTNSFLIDYTTATEGWK